VKKRKPISQAMTDPAAQAFIAGKTPPAPAAARPAPPAQPTLPNVPVPPPPASSASSALVSVTYRFNPDLLDRLRHAADVRRSTRTPPHSQQAIIAAALDEWLKSNGF
jgi:hypothetical protein